MTLGEPQQRTDLPLLNIVHQRTNRPRLLQPITLPQLPRPDALEGAGLVVEAAGHGPAVDGVHDPVLAEEPHFVAPLLGRARGRVRRVVVVDQVRVADVGVEGGVEGGVGLEGWEGGGHCWFLFLVGGVFFSLEILDLAVGCPLCVDVSVCCGADWDPFWVWVWRLFWLVKGGNL